MVIVLGGSGYVGSAFMQILALHGIEARSLSREKIDYTNFEALRGFLAKERPSFLINCAGYTGKPNVDACEVHRWKTLAGNAVLPGIIHQACSETDTPWGHISSGCIFNGNRGVRPDGSLIGFSEEDVPNFAFGSRCSFYSGTKALGEESLGWGMRNGRWQHSSSPGCYVWRLRIPFSSTYNPRNYLTKIISYKRLLDASNSISHLSDFVEASIRCWQTKQPCGIYNLTNPGCITTRQITEIMREESQRRQAEGRPNPFDKNFDFFESEEEFMKLAALTPRSNCVMDTAKSEAANLGMRPVLEALHQSIAAYE